jgi:hypothetical protein
MESLIKLFLIAKMDTYTRAAIKIQSVWRMWLQKRKYEFLLHDYHTSQYYEEYTEEELRDMELDACEAEFEYKYHMFHCGGY